ncbi:lipocalin-like domain-containing protein [Rohdeia mirabilis]|uniref:lipocalin-like domain-containing protein n=1 Tax=Rohdeia mirabilis TaxID=2528008 RepID=UPI003AF4069D
MTDDGWPSVPRELELTYPRDHGAHPEYRTEWWYVTGQGEAPDGRRFGVQFTIFRVGLTPLTGVETPSDIALRQAYAGHFAITDVAAGRLRHSERLQRGGTPLATASLEDLDVRLLDWRIHRTEDDVLHITAGDRVEGIAVDLELAPTKPRVLHGENGWSRKGLEVTNASAYASFTRLALDGTVSLDGASIELDGTAWFDQEFGSSVLGEGVVGWDWFGLHLDDGRDLMCFVLRRDDGSIDPASAATLVDQDGDARPLTRDEFELTSSGAWTSPVSGATYPNRWSVSILDEALELDVEPFVANCELVTGASTDVSYWEGPVRITGRSRGAPIAGTGYGELTGYAGSMGGRL